MSPERQRIAIAEACGTINVNAVCWRGHKDGIEVKIPDYLNDLNAMHDAENHLTWEQSGEHNEHLCDILKPDEHVYHAAATQRAEAFLRTLNLWQE